MEQSYPTITVLRAISRKSPLGSYTKSRNVRVDKHEIFCTEIRMVAQLTTMGKVARMRLATRAASSYAG